VDGKALLRIGDFSRASCLSVKSLRAYHDAGLLVPADVDPRTGYRSYSVAQLTDAAIIRRLRLLDVPLEAIGQVLDARDPTMTKKVLSDHGAVLQERLTVMQRSIDELQGALDMPALHTPVHRRHEQALTVLTLTGTVSEASWLAFLDRGLAALSDAAAAAGAVVAGPFGGCYPTLLDDDAQEVVAFLPVASPPLLPASWRAEGVRVAELPTTEVAVVAHHGPYDDMDDTYRNLGAWVAEHAEPADLPVRELYLIGRADTDDLDELRTELCWPIRSADV
jgi:DNA-binding transcriptional MerR regulator/effector-binding domain-containing protein